MTTLTQASIVARKIIRYGIFLIIFLIIGKFVLDQAIKVYRHYFPVPPPPPTVAFEKLPRIPYPEKSRPNVTFSIETAQGGLPTLSTQAKVFFMPKISANLLGLDFAKQKAEDLGFQVTEEKLSDTLYGFSHKNAPAKLEYNIVTGNFSISYDLRVDSSPLDRRPPAPEVAASVVRSYLSSANLFPDDLSGETTFEFLKLEGDKFTSSISLSEADFVEVNFFRKNYDDLPVYTSDPANANVWFIVSGLSERGKQIMAGQYHYFPVDAAQGSTYPIISSQQAWDELTQGGGYIATLGANSEGDNIVIRRIFVGYYDAGIPTEFLQPIIVFEGDKGFLAYVSGVTSDYVRENEQTPQPTSIPIETTPTPEASVSPSPTSLPFPTP